MGLSRTAPVATMAGLVCLVALTPSIASAENAAAGTPDLATGLTWTPTSPEIGETILFTITGHSGDIRAEWNFGENGCAGNPQIQVCSPSFSNCHDFSFKFASGGDKNVSVTVKNPSTGAVLGSATQTITVQNVGSCDCNFNLGNNSAGFGPSGGTGSFQVNASDVGCSWQASTSAAWWIQISNGSNHTGTGPLTYLVAENYTGHQRSATIDIVGSGGFTDQFTVIQSGGALRKIVPPGAEPNGFAGGAVATTDNTLVMGAPWADQPGGNMAGRTFILQSTDGGEWESYSELQFDPPYTGPDQSYGQSVAINGRTMVVGAPGSRHCGDHEDYGAVYVYTDHNPAGNWTGWVMKTICPGIFSSPGMRFGSGVSLSGNVIAVGASESEIGGVESGSVYLYIDTSPYGDWFTYDELMIQASDPESADFFGHSLDIDDRTLVVGAYGTSDTGSQSGSVYVFTDLSPPGDWSIIWETKLPHPSPLPLARYGWDVAVHQRTVVASVPFDYISDHLSGSIQVFVDQSPNNNWVSYSQVTIGPEDGHDWDEYGASVDVEGTNILVGAPNAYSNHIQSGAAYLLIDTSATGGWDSNSSFVLPVLDADSGDWVGQSVALSPSLGAIGAPKDTNQYGPFVGSAYLWVETSSFSPIYADGFETGDTSAWSATTP